MSALLATLALAVVALGANAAAAMALSPAVETSPATAVAEKGATLNGTVNPGGAETKTYFEYGTTTSYGSKTAEVGVGSGTTTLEHSQAVSGLSPNTTYHYRIVATNSAGSSQGADKTFTTVGPPAVTTPEASGGSGEEATLKSTVDPNGQSTTYQFEYGTESGSYSHVVPVPAGSVGSGLEPVAVDQKATGLTPGTPYFLRVSATNASGKVVSGEISFMSSWAPGIQVAPVSGLTRTEATLNATLTAFFGAKYWFEYGTTTAYGSKTATKEISGGEEEIPVSQAISGLSASTVYHYRVVAENFFGKHTGPDQTFTTLSPVTLYQKGGGQLFKGSPLKTFSTNLTFSNESEGHGCTESELGGEVKENPGAVQSVTALKMQSGEGVGCSWKPSYSIKYSTPTTGITLEFMKNGAGEGFARSSKFILMQTVYYEKVFKVVECEYALSLAGTFKTATALEPVLSGTTEVLKGNANCPGSESVTGNFVVTNKGIAVEAK